MSVFRIRGRPSRYRSCSRGSTRALTITLAVHFPSFRGMYWGGFRAQHTPACIEVVELTTGGSSFGLGTPRHPRGIDPIGASPRRTTACSTISTAHEFLRYHRTRHVDTWVVLALVTDTGVVPNDLEDYDDSRHYTRRVSRSTFLMDLAHANTTRKSLGRANSKKETATTLPKVKHK
jgi:hypothetical protein